MSGRLSWVFFFFYLVYWSGVNSLRTCSPTVTKSGLLCHSMNGFNLKAKPQLGGGRGQHEGAKVSTPIDGIRMMSQQGLCHFLGQVVHS